MPIDEVFPELKESEDERIRKRLVEYFNVYYDRFSSGNNVNVHWEGLEVKSVIAYLERQKEQKSLNISAASEWLREHVRRYINSEYNEFHKCVEYDGSIDKERLINDFEEAMQKEQKPAEWSEKDEKDIQEASDYLRDYVNNCVRGGNSKLYLQSLADRIESLRPQPKQEWSEDFEENIRMLLHNKLTWHSEDGSMSSTVFIDDKTLKDIVSGIWFYVGKEALKYPNKEIHVQEWSEEDEDKVDDICKLIEYATIIPRSGDDDTGIPPTRLNDKYKGELKAFVKSLRNLPTKSDTWKPNEEQMEEFRKIIMPYERDRGGRIIYSLYDQLKAL